MSQLNPGLVQDLPRTRELSGPVVSGVFVLDQSAAVVRDPVLPDARGRHAFFSVDQEDASGVCSNPGRRSAGSTGNTSTSQKLD